MRPGALPVRMATINSQRLSSARPPVSGISGRRTGAAEHLVAMQRNVQLALEIGLLGHLHPDHRARLEGDGARGIAERAVAVRGSQARRVEHRLSSKLTPGTVVEERVQELNFVRRRAHHLKQPLQSPSVANYVLPVIEQRQLGELRVEFDAAFESRLGAGL